MLLASGRRPLRHRARLSFVAWHVTAGRGERRHCIFARNDFDDLVIVFLSLHLVGLLPDDHGNWAYHLVITGAVPHLAVNRTYLVPRTRGP